MVALTFDPNTQATEGGSLHKNRGAGGGREKVRRRRRQEILNYLGIYTVELFLNKRNFSRMDYAR